MVSHYGYHEPTKYGGHHILTLKGPCNVFDLRGYGALVKINENANTIFRFFSFYT